MLNVSLKKILLSASVFSLFLASASPSWSMQEEKSKSKTQKRRAAKKRAQQRVTAAPQVPEAQKGPAPQPHFKPGQSLKSKMARRAELGIYIPRSQEETNQRAALIATQVYRQMNTTWTYALPGHPISTTSAYWEAIGTNGNSPTLMIKKIDPETIIPAFEDLLSKPASVDPTIALTTAKIFCIMDLLGKRNFATFACNFYNVIRRTDGCSRKGYFHELPYQFMSEQIPGEIIPGSIGFLTNISLYSTYKPNGHAKGETVFCVGKEVYQCFSPGAGHELFSLRGMETNLLNEFIRSDDVEKGRKEHTALVGLFTKKPENFYEIRGEDQNLSNFYEVFSQTEIADFNRTKVVVEYDY